MSTGPLIPRPDLQTALREALERRSVLLQGPRRVGKSTLVETLAEEGPPDLTVLRVDLEGYRDAPVESLVEQVRLRLQANRLLAEPTFAGRIESVEVAGVGGTLRPAAQRAPWERLERDLVEAFGGLETGRLVVALDEVPWWLDAIEEGAPGGARAALASLRRIRQLRAFADRLRFILTGSIGLAGLAAELGASAELNDLETVPVPPMSEDQAATLFETELAARGRACEPAVARDAARLAGGSPHWVKRLASLVGLEGARAAVDLERAVEALLAPALRRELADEGREHFRRRHPERFPVMVAILDAVAGADEGHAWQGAVNAAMAADATPTRRGAEEAIYLLIDGYYLRRAPDGTLGWVNPLLRRWWLRYGGP